MIKIRHSEDCLVQSNVEVCVVVSDGLLTLADSVSKLTVASVDTVGELRRGKALGSVQERTSLLWMFPEKLSKSFT